MHKTWLISDLHFDHENIIRYCNRPFVNATEMNEILLNNWNNLVLPQDEVYFLGDMAFGRGSRPPSFWLSKLHGQIHFIRGNHDREKINAKESDILEYGNRQFLLIHDPEKKPTKWQGWTIHGHKHNNDLKNYPFINGEKKTINVSAELVNYQPLDLDFLINLNLDRIKYMETIARSRSNPENAASC